MLAGPWVVSSCPLPPATVTTMTACPGTSAALHQGQGSSEDADNGEGWHPWMSLLPLFFTGHGLSTMQCKCWFLVLNKRERKERKKVEMMSRIQK